MEKTNFMRLSRRLVLPALFALSTVILAAVIICASQLGALRSSVSEELSGLSAAVSDLADGTLAADSVIGNALFVMRATQNGTIGVYSMTDGSCIDEIGVYLYSLPQADREYLEKGILVYSVGELLSLYEDYTS